jgi:hypothetical protein
MPRRKPKRDNDYYLDRLRVEYPAIFADLQAGKFKNASEAFVAAGLRKQQSGLTTLQAAWNKATATERDAFKALIGCVAHAGSSSGTLSPAKNIAAPHATAQAIVTPIHVDGHLKPSVVANINAIKARRGIKTGVIMRELGFEALNPSLGLALSRDWRIKDPAILDAIASWLVKNSA